MGVISQIAAVWLIVPGANRDSVILTMKMLYLWRFPRGRNSTEHVQWDTQQTQKLCLSPGSVFYNISMDVSTREVLKLLRNFSFAKKHSLCLLELKDKHNVFWWVHNKALQVTFNTVLLHHASISAKILLRDALMKKVIHASLNYLKGGHLSFLTFYRISN